MTQIATQAFFPCVPDYMSWEDWNGNLAIYYGSELITFAPEDDWKVAASDIAELPTFAVYPVPQPDTYDDWQSWARDFTEAINGPSR